MTAKSITKQEIKISLSYNELDTIRSALGFIEETHTDSCAWEFENEHKDYVEKCNVVHKKLTQAIPNPFIKNKGEN